MIGSARVGERRLLALVAEFGLETVHRGDRGGSSTAPSARRAPCIASGRTASITARRCSTTTATASRTSTSAPRSPSRAATSTVDLTDSHDQVIGLRQLVVPQHACPRCVALAYLIDPRTPKNDGAFRPVTVIAREGTVVWPYPPRAGDAVHQPLRAGDHRGDHQGAGAGAARTAPWRAGARRFRIAIQGVDPRNEQPFIWHLFQRAAGRRRLARGRRLAETAGEWQAAGGIKFGSLEVAEVRFPLFFRRHEFRPDCGGDGRYRGGPGVGARAARWRPPSRRVGNTAGDGVRYRRLRHAGRQGRRCRIATAALAAARRACSRPRRSASRSGRATCSSSSPWAAAATGRPRARPAEARAADRVNGFVTAKPRRGKA